MHDADRTTPLRCTAGTGRGASGAQARANHHSIASPYPPAPVGGATPTTRRTPGRRATLSLPPSPRSRVPLGPTFTAALILALVATPAARALGWRLGWLDHPDGGRKRHPSPIPRTGGLAVVAAWGLVAAGAGVPWAILLPTLAMAALGLADDAWDLRPRTKLAVQLLVGALVGATPLALDTVLLPGVGALALGPLAVPATALWFAGVVNAQNLIDGLDGLSGGVGLVAASAFAGLLLAGAPGAALAAAALAGALGGFLPWNVHRARVFLGDCGALAVGAVLATTSLATAAALPITVPLLVLLVPVGDMVLTLLRRAVAGAPLLRGDRGHVHHRLLDLGLPHTGAVAALWSVGTVGACAAVASTTDPRVAIGAALGGGVLVVLTALALGYLRPAHRVGQRA